MILWIVKCLLNIISDEKQVENNFKPIYVLNLMKHHQIRGVTKCTPVRPCVQINSVFQNKTPALKIIEM
jgi:hypothetical protein